MGTAAPPLHSGDPKGVDAPSPGVSLAQAGSAGLSSLVSNRPDEGPVTWSEPQEKNDFAGDLGKNSSSSGVASAVVLHTGEGCHRSESVW